MILVFTIGNINLSEEQVPPGADAFLALSKLCDQAQLTHGVVTPLHSSKVRWSTKNQREMKL
jgi:hypothetical protein